MKMRNAARVNRWRAAILTLVMAGALSASASAAVTDLTLDPTAALSPGHMHVLLTGSITCDPGDTPYLNGQVVQPRGTSGIGYTLGVCDGTPRPYTIDVTTGFFSPAGAFKPGRANAQVSTTICTPWTMLCTSKYADAAIRLTN